MAERITTARPYAKAIFALARKGNTLAETSAGLSAPLKWSPIRACMPCWAART